MEQSKIIDTLETYHIPSAPRVNYSLLVMESAGMMKMATGEGSPFGRVPEKGPDLFLVAAEACGGGTPDLLCSSMFLGYMDIYRRKKSARGATRSPRGWRACPGGRARLPASWLPRSFPDVYSKSPGLLPFQKLVP